MLKSDKGVETYLKGKEKLKTVKKKSSHILWYHE